jgi:hypothetical protein
MAPPRLLLFLSPFRVLQRAPVRCRYRGARRPPTMTKLWSGKLRVITRYWAITRVLPSSLSAAILQGSGRDTGAAGQAIAGVLVIMSIENEWSVWPNPVSMYRRPALGLASLRILRSAKTTRMKSPASYHISVTRLRRWASFHSQNVSTSHQLTNRRLRHLCRWETKRSDCSRTQNCESRCHLTL